VKKNALQSRLTKAVVLTTAIALARLSQISVDNL